MPRHSKQGLAKLLAKVIIDLDMAYNGLITIDPKTFKGMNCPATFFDAEHGEFVQEPRFVLQGVLHPNDKAWVQSLNHQLTRCMTDPDMLEWKESEEFKLHIIGLEAHYQYLFGEKAK